MSLESLTEKIRKKLILAPHIKAKVKFDLGDDGIIFIDNTQSPPVITHADDEADTTLACSAATFDGILDGTQDPNIAFMTGKLKIRGSMGIAMKLNSVLEG